MNGLSGEDRARLELLAEVCGQYIGGACRRALALIDQQEKALEAADETLRWYAHPDHWLDGQAGEWVVEEGNHVSGDGFAHNEFEHDNGERARAYRSARATSTKEDG